MKSCFFSFLSLLFVVMTSRAADWPHWRGPWQNGVSPEKNLPAKWSPTGENLIWKAPYGCRSTPLVMNGRVYLINYAAEHVKKNGKIEDVPQTIQERVLCLDANTGKFINEHRFNVFQCDIVTVRLGWTDLAGDPKTGNVYAHGSQGYLNAYDKDLKRLWSRQLTEEFGRVTGYGGRVTSPLVEGDLVILGMINSSWGDQAKGNDRFFAFNKYDGSVVWVSEPRPEQRGTYYSHAIAATINGVRLVITGTSDGSVAAMQANTGQVAWSYNLSIAPINSSPVFDPKTKYVYIGSGEESPDNNVQGRIVCVDAGKVEDGAPALVWQKDGIKARYASPILDTQASRLYVPDDQGQLYCFEAKSGKQLWKFRYGRNARGSPVLADGKIYVGDVFSKFSILQPGDKKCVKLHEHFFPSPDGDVEVNGTPAVANGRVYFATSDEFFCIGLKDAKPAKNFFLVPPPALPPGKATQLQVLPAEVRVHPGESVSFRLRTFDEKGNFVAEEPVKDASWSLPTPPPPPGKKISPPPLKGEIAEGRLTVDAKLPSQHGYLLVKANGLTARARVRVAPRLPYTQDFEKVPEGTVPGGWINTQGKFYVAKVEGNNVLKKVNNSSKPPIVEGFAYIGTPAMKDYTIQCDVLGTVKKMGTDEQMPEIGIVANRYTLLLAGNIQKLRILSWEVLPRIDQTIGFAWKPGVWYRMKLTVAAKGQVFGKVWQRDQPEPKAWTVSVTDPRPNTEGTPALFGAVTGVAEPRPGNDIYYDNVIITPNKK